jgi:hypothetical protein
VNSEAVNRKSECHSLLTILLFTRASGALNFPSIKGGFPHSEIHGSKLIRSSPWLIAAYHVLHRLCMPRHPPNALISLNCSHCQCSSVWKLAFPRLNNGRKTSFSRYDQWPRLGRPIMMRLPSRELRRTHFWMPDHIFSLRFLQNRRSASAPQTFDFHSECEGMVELSGIEPLTPCLQSRCSTN